jgi:hypothetical protein
LTLPVEEPKSGLTVSDYSSNFYARWRKHCPPDLELRETATSRPPEVLLQNIWVRQRLQRGQLLTTDGKPLTVLHPGFWNREAGPDFHGAVIRIGENDVRQGDVEIDLNSGGWKAHGHDRNPNFNNVVLHVVWETSEKTKIDLPTVVIRDFLDTSISELHDLLDGDSPPPLTADQQGKCCAPLTQLHSTKLEELLNSAARVRLESRAGRIRARAKQVGWEQTLIEGMFRALGYKNNAWPMQHLGEISPKIRAGLSDHDPLHWQSALLGISGLLPDQLDGRLGDTDAYVKTVWDIWWRDRDRFEALIVPEKTWRLTGVRPANHPQRRLALAAHWLSDVDFFTKLETWFADLPANETGKAVAASEDLFKILNPKKDAFWQNHWTLRSDPMARPQPLLGTTRISDLVMNIVLPWFFTRAAAGKNQEWRDKDERLWLAWPKAEDNALLRQARARLLGNAGPRVLKTAAHQQGLLQIVRDYCDHSNAICEQCPFPSLVTDWHRSDDAGQ